MALKVKFTEVDSATLPTRDVEWSEKDDAPTFTLSPLTDKELEAVRDKSVDPDNPTRTVRRGGFRTTKEPNVLDKMIGVETIVRIIKGFKNLKYKHIAEFVDPDKLHIQFDANVQEEIIPCDRDTHGVMTGDAKDLIRKIAEGASIWFREWLSQCSIDFAEFQKQEQEDLSKNSRSTSGGG